MDTDLKSLDLPCHIQEFCNIQASDLFLPDHSLVCDSKSGSVFWRFSG